MYASLRSHPVIRAMQPHIAQLNRSTGVREMADESEWMMDGLEKEEDQAMQPQGERGKEEERGS